MNPRSSQEAESPVKAARRIRFLYAAFVVVIGIFFIRLFYLQIIRHDYYSKSALSDQLKEYEIPAARGLIKAHEGDQVVPIVLNEKLFTVFADPTLVKDAGKAAETLAAVLKGNVSDYEKKLKSTDTRYVIIAKKVSPKDKEAILKKKYPGIAAQEVPYRTYPNGALAAQVLGFVNDEGKGSYGLEQELNKRLAGNPGQLKAVTDVKGVPLAANTENIRVAPTSGDDIVLTLDMAMQKQLESILQQGLKDAKSDSGSALIMEASTGTVKAMANWPTYDPGAYFNVEDGNVFNNAAVSSPLEVGSIMKPLTAAAALDMGAVQPGSTYYDPSSFKIDGYTVKNIEEDGGPGTKSITDIVDLSLNTGATWLLMRMGGSSTEINRTGREAWHNYMVNRYMFGKTTGIEQGYEADGLVPDPNKGFGRDLTYANTSFGQAMTATGIQMAAAFAAIVNGGTYYQPRLIDFTVDRTGKTTKSTPKVVKKDVVSPAASNAIKPMLEHVISTHYFKRKFDQKSYAVGGKTGTAQIANPTGGYLENDYNGTYLGFVGGDHAQYVIFVRVDKPKIAGYAGSQAAQPLFGNLAHMLIDNFNVVPKGQ